LPAAVPETSRRHEITVLEPSKAEQWHDARTFLSCCMGEGVLYAPTRFSPGRAFILPFLFIGGIIITGQEAARTMRSAVLPRRARSSMSLP